jgi:multiple sugar transport system permease protein
MSPALASSDSVVDTEPGGPVPSGPALRARATRRATDTVGAWRSDGAARWVLIWPAVIVILFLSIFPLVASVALSLSKLVFRQGGVDLKLIGFSNYYQLLFGTEQSHFLGVLKTPTPLGWLILVVGIGMTAWAFGRAVRGGQVGPGGLALRLMAGIVLVGFMWLLVGALASNGGRPGALIVTFIFVFVGIGLQLFLGLGLAMLCVQAVPWRRFFRVAFLIPLTITPVGVGYMFLMMTDTSKGPLEPIWVGLGLRNFSWVTDPWAARVAVIIGDTWQWTPFVFIVLLAALESLDQEVREAAVVDGASRWQSFRSITTPAILPVVTTIVLIRLIEGFKIIDMPNILLGGGPGTATQSMSLQAYIDWNTLNLGRSAAVAYLLLIVVTLVATAYVSVIRRRVTTVV